MTRLRMAKATPKGPTLLEQQCQQRGLPPVVREYRFATNGRGWRFDYCWPFYKVALEVEGGVFSNRAVDVDTNQTVYLGGRHTRGRAFLNDMEKYNHAALEGWLLLRCTPETIKTRAALESVIQGLEVRGWKDSGHGREG